MTDSSDASPPSPASPPGPLSAPEPWELVAGGYAAEVSLVMGPISAKALELVKIDANARAIDVATGPGTVALALAPRVREVCALDFAPQMIAELEKETARRGISNVRAVVGDGQSLPYADREFSLGFSMFGLMFFPDRARGFRELRRVLAKEGTAVVSSWAPIEDSPLMSLMFGALRAADPTFPSPRRDVASLENPEVLANEMRAGGFDDVVVHSISHAVTDIDDATLWERMVRSSAPLLLLRRRLGETEWRKRSEVAEHYLLEEVAKMRRNSPLSTTANVAVGRVRSQ